MKKVKFAYPPELDEACLAEYRTMLSLHDCSADDILANRNLRDEYVNQVQRSLSGFCSTEERILRDLMRLRKAKRLPRSRPEKGADDA
jgi:hypothetical protein